MTKRLGEFLDPYKLILPELLEERCQYYEHRLAEHENRLNALASSSSQFAPSQTMSIPTMALAQTLHHPSLADMLDPGPSTSTSTLPDLSHMPDLTSANFDFATAPNSFGPSASPSGLSNISVPDPHILPPAELVHDLINLFYTHIHPWAPILSPVMLSFSGPPWNILVHSIVVVTLRLSSDPRLEGRKDRYKQAAKQYVLSHAIESTSISSVQALAILALDLIGSDQGPSSWGILALLTRSAVHLGLTSEDDTQNPSSTHSTTVGPGSAFSTRPPAPSLSRTSIIPPAANWREDESRRRLFWLIFALDRYACVSTGWDFALPDFDIKRRLPCADEIWLRNVCLLANCPTADNGDLGMVHCAYFPTHPPSPQTSGSKSTKPIRSSRRSTRSTRQSPYSAVSSHRSRRCSSRR
jgi:hypothetical protein